MSNKKEKFSPIELFAKKKLKQTRLKKELTMRQASDGMGISRKVLEDIETLRPYGCHISIDILVTSSRLYGVPVSTFIE